MGALQQKYKLTRLDLKSQSEIESVYACSDGTSLVFKMDPYQKGSVRYVDYHVNGMLLKREWYGTKRHYHQEKLSQ